jgi:hypothetical protein
LLCITQIFSTQAVAAAGHAKKVIAAPEVQTNALVQQDLTSLVPTNPSAFLALKARTNKNLLKHFVLTARPATSALKGR